LVRTKPGDFVDRRHFGRESPDHVVEKGSPVHDRGCRPQVDVHIGRLRRIIR
jgi:hypothetical protein